jgi:uncharacterized protein (UPF0335 family)
MPDGSSKPTSHVGARLLSYLQRVERLEEEKKALTIDIGDIKQEVKSAGFDIKVFNALLKERRLDTAERREFQELLDIYRAAVGDLDGTPLGDHARERLMKMTPPTQPDLPKPDKPKGKKSGGVTDADIDAARAAEPPAADIPAPPSADELEAVRREGALAAKAGMKVTQNPHPAGDPRRAAWDEGWCGEMGSDGMEIPEAFRRKPKPKPDAKGDAE